jgi:hypothetical protein
VSAELFSALDNVDEPGCTAIVAQMIIAEHGGYKPGSFHRAEFETRIERLREESDFLGKLAIIAPRQLLAAYTSATSHFCVSRSKDAAAIYEWLTCRTAGREVDRVDHVDKGPFFGFVSTLWPVIFDKEHGRIV